MDKTVKIMPIKDLRPGDRIIYMAPFYRVMRIEKQMNGSFIISARRINHDNTAPPDHIRITRPGDATIRAIVERQTDIEDSISALEQKWHRAPEEAA